jgi:von Willebrand factor/Uncharacterized protein YfbK, C-terminal
MRRPALRRSRPSRRALAALLRGGRPPEPPADLAARIKAEIPEDLAAGAGDEELPRPSPARRRPWLLAASLAAALGGGVVAYRTLHPGSVAAPAAREGRLVQKVNAPAAAAAGAGNEEPAALPPAGGVVGKAQAIAGGAEPAAVEKRRADRGGGAATGVGADEAGGRAPAPAAAPRRQGLAAGYEAGEAPAAAVAEAKGEEGSVADLGAPAGTVHPPIAQGASATPEPPSMAERETAPQSSGEAFAAPAAAPATAAASREAPVGRVAARADERLEEARKLVATPDAASRPQPPAAGVAAEPSARLRVALSGATGGSGTSFVDAAGDPRSTFGLDVGTGSYDEVRRFLAAGRLPPPEAVRVEELVNAFDYGDPRPAAGEDFALAAEGAPTPFAGGERARLLRFALRGRAAAPGPSGAPTSGAGQLAAPPVAAPPVAAPPVGAAPVAAAPAGTPQIIAVQARVEVDFDPAVVARWRLLGYTDRGLAGEPSGAPGGGGLGAGELRAGQRVTALYEVELQPAPAAGRPVATLRLRYRPAAGGEAREVARTLRTGDLARRWEAASPALRLASLAAALGEVLRGAPGARGADAGEIYRRARRLAAQRPGDGRAAELAALAGKAAQLLGAGGGP